MHSMQTKCPMVFACDTAYAMPLATALRSIAEANTNLWPLDFHVFEDGISGDLQMKILRSLPRGAASIRWLPVALGNFREFATLPYVSKMTYARFLIPSAFPDTIRKVLYLDADILALDKLDSLLETDVDDFVLGAVLDGIDALLKHGEPGLEQVPCVRDYFNAGVLLINLGRWRKDQISERALDYLVRNPRSPYSDQDALNFVCDGRWKQLDPRWNYQEFRDTKSIADMGPEERPSIVHFAWYAKPWMLNSHNRNAAFYDAFRSRTCFAREPLDKMRDSLHGHWDQVKGVLRRYPLLRCIRNRVRGI